MSYRSSLVTAGFLLPAGLFLPIATSLAADVSWNNPGAGAFTTGTNWTPNTVPTASDNAIIANGGTAQLTTGESASVIQLRVNNGALTQDSATVTTGITSSSWQTTGDLQVGGSSGQTGSLTVSGASTINTGRVRIGGYNTGSDSSNVAGNLTMTGGNLITGSGGGYDLWVGNGTGSTGVLNLSGSAQVTVNSSMTSGRAGGNGTVDLSGSSKLKTTGATNIGEGGTAGWTVSGGASFETSSNLIMGGAASSLTVQDSATVSVGGEFQIGNGGGSTGNVILTGGTVTANSWMSIGRQGGTGTLTMSGNAALIKTAGTTLLIGDGTTGTLTMSGNASITADSNIRLGFGSGGIGTLTMSGGTVQTTGILAVGENGGQGTLNLNGGTITANSVSKLGGSGTLNFNGGTLKARVSSVDILSGFTSGNLNLQAGGLIVDTDGNDVLASSPLSGTGGLTKTGAGTLLLSGVSTYTGQTVIGEGSLTLGGSGIIADASAVTLNGGTLNLNNFNETLAALTLGSTSTIDFGGTPGTNILTFANSSGIVWSGSLILSNFEVGVDTLNFSAAGGLTGSQLNRISLSGYTATGLTGTGDVIFAAVPESEHYALGAFMVLSLAILGRRKRLAS